MRLLTFQNDGQLVLTRDLLEELPPYAILSHTWGQDKDEVTFQEVSQSQGSTKTGYRKIEFCGKQAAADGYTHFWVDSCCIDKSNNAELSEALNSMFRWYQNAARCYVYLADVSIISRDEGGLNLARSSWISAFKKSRWFTRGWTLQELVAPSNVQFFSAEWQQLGDKESLVQDLYEITGISVGALQGTPLSEISADVLMSWSAGRQTKRGEDMAYCLLGMFNVYLPPIYGEGKEHALLRLKEEIAKRRSGTGISYTGAVSGSNQTVTSPRPSVVIPFGRDTDFVERGAIFDEIYRRCAEPGSRIALVGLGGIGKSQLAIEYAYRVRDRSPDTWVFWIHASNAARFESSFRDITNYLQIPGRYDKDANIFQLVHDWLRDEHRKWLLILDNLDDVSYLLGVQNNQLGSLVGENRMKQQQPLAAYLPQCPNGSILVTTRSKDAVRNLVEDCDMLIIEPMSKDEALTLLQKKLAIQRDDKLGDLVEELEYMPLAIVQAAAYITKRQPRCSVQQYLDQYRASDRKKESLLSQEGGQPRRDREAKNSIITTWQISFEHVRQSRPSAADLLSLMSFFDRQGIPEILLRIRTENKITQSKAPEHLVGGRSEVDVDESDDGNSDGSDDETNSSTSSASDDDGFEEDIVTLREYCFISVNDDGGTFEMHRLVQIATRKWLTEHNQSQQWEAKFLQNLDTELPDGEYENWPTCQLFFPHVMLTATRKPKSPDLLRDWASILYKGAWYTCNMHNGVQTEMLSSQATRAWKKIFGQEDIRTLWSMEILGRGLDLQGRWDEAEKMFLQVIEARKKTLGEEHPDTLNSMANLASTYGNQGRWEMAETLEVQVVEIRMKNLGVDHPTTLATMNNLATTYMSQGRWVAAEQVFKQLLETRKRTLGEGHPSTLNSMNNLALIYEHQGQWQAAETLNVQVMETYTQQLGEAHPTTLTSMTNLALIYGNQGRWQAAETLNARVVEIRKEQLGEEHPSTLNSMNNLAQVYVNQGRWDAAEAINVQVVETCRKKLGEDHPTTLSSMNNLVFIYQVQGRWKAAETLILQVVEACKKKLGEDHPHTLTSMANLASAYSNQGLLEAAEALNVQVMEIRKTKLGEDHPDTLASMNNLAFTLKESGKVTEAIRLMQQCVELMRTKIGPQHPHTSSSSKALAEWEAESLTLHANG
ncbi:hypothetical protein BX600DRAFT_490989 [Xylariales sp. PMI_506]|nr:hypothetical protein BX600DRAFT_490989 [Xylariales sp. PMI_506]